MRLRVMIKVVFFLLLLFPFNIYSIEVPEETFVSLRSDEVNLRAGPGNEYPIKYVYQLKDMPLMVLGEYDNWYKVKDKDNEEAWVSKNLTTKKRTLIVVNGTQIMYKKPDVKSKPLLRIEENVVLKYSKCVEGWCKAEVAGKAGWIEKSGIWGY